MKHLWTQGLLGSAMGAGAGNVTLQYSSLEGPKMMTIRNDELMLYFCFKFTIKWKNVFAIRFNINNRFNN